MSLGTTGKASVVVAFAPPKLITTYSWEICVDEGYFWNYVNKKENMSIYSCNLQYSQTEFQYK